MEKNKQPVKSLEEYMKTERYLNLDDLERESFREIYYNKYVAPVHKDVDEKLYLKNAAALDKKNIKDYREEWRPGEQISAGYDESAAGIAKDVYDRVTKGEKQQYAPPAEGLANKVTRGLTTAVVDLPLYAGMGYATGGTGLVAGSAGLTGLKSAGRRYAAGEEFNKDAYFDIGKEMAIDAGTNLATLGVGKGLSSLVDTASVPAIKTIRTALKKGDVDTAFKEFDALSSTTESGMTRKMAQIASRKPPRPLTMRAIAEGGNLASKAQLAETPIEMGINAGATYLMGGDTYDAIAGAINYGAFKGAHHLAGRPKGTNEPDIETEDAPLANKTEFFNLTKSVKRAEKEGVLDPGTHEALKKEIGFNKTNEATFEQMQEYKTKFKQKLDESVQKEAPAERDFIAGNNPKNIIREANALYKSLSRSRGNDPAVIRAAIEESGPRFVQDIQSRPHFALALNEIIEHRGDATKALKSYSNNLRTNIGTMSLESMPTEQYKAVLGENAPARGENITVYSHDGVSPYKPVSLTPYEVEGVPAQAYTIKQSDLLPTRKQGTLLYKPAALEKRMDMLVGESGVVGEKLDRSVNYSGGKGTKTNAIKDVVEGKGRVVEGITTNHKGMLNYKESDHIIAEAYNKSFAEDTMPVGQFFNYWKTGSYKGHPVVNKAMMQAQANQVKDSNNMAPQIKAIEDIVKAPRERDELTEVGLQERVWGRDLMNQLMENPDNPVDYDHALAIAEEQSKQRIREKFADKPHMAEAYELMREMYSSLLDRVNEERAIVGKEPIKRDVNYMAFIADMNDLNKKGYTFEKSAEMLRPTNKGIQDPRFRFGHEASLKNTEMKKLDAVRAFATYAQNALREIHYGPVVEKLKMIADAKDAEGNNVLNPYARKELIEEVNHAMTGSLKAETKNVWDKLFRKLRESLSVSTLMLSAPSVMLQGTAYVFSITEIGPINAAIGLTKALSVVTPYTGGKERYLKAMMDSDVMEIRRSSRGMEEIFEKISDTGNFRRVKNAITKFGTLPTTYADLFFAYATWEGAMAKARKDGLTHEEATLYADEVVTKTQGSSASFEKAKVMKSEAGALGLIFQTYNLANANYIVHELVGKSFREPTAKQFGKVLTFALFSQVANQIYKAIGIEAPFPDVTTEEDEAVGRIREGVKFVPGMSSMGQGLMPLKVAQDIYNIGENGTPVEDSLYAIGKGLGIPAMSAIRRWNKGKDLQQKLFGRSYKKELKDKKMQRQYAADAKMAEVYRLMNK